MVFSIGISTGHGRQQIETDCMQITLQRALQMHLKEASTWLALLNSKNCSISSMQGLDLMNINHANASSLYQQLHQGFQTQQTDHSSKRIRKALWNASATSQHI
jgi:hypothetical protein